MEVLGGQIDWEYLSEISGGDAEFEHDLVQTFLDAAPALLDAFAKSITTGDATTARHSAHTLKGSSRSIGAFQFAEVCENAEKSARIGDLEICQLLQNQITVAYEALKTDADEFLANAA